MNWIANVVRPRIRGVFRKRETPDNLWIKCPACTEMIFHRDLKAALHVCPHCDHHMKMGAEERLAALFDTGAHERIDVPETPTDPLRFRDRRRYAERLREARARTGQRDAILVSRGRVNGVETVIAVHDFAFLGGSLGSAAGEAIVAGGRAAHGSGTPYVVVTASGGARMQEGIVSLMQMPRTVAVLQMLRDAALPYVVILTNPTTGGVTASYAMLGDVHLAEPGALIGFTGPRVIEQTIRQTLPEGFQRSEFLLEHGMVDMVVHRHEMASALGRVLRLLTRRAPGMPPGEAPADAGADASAPPAALPAIPPPA